MPAESHNQDGPSRLDRMERLMDRLIQDHANFQEDHRQLLTAQVLMTDSMKNLILSVEKLAGHVEWQDGRIDKLTETLEKVVEIQSESQKQIAASRKESAESRKEFDERLNALINIVDNLIRKRPPQ
jgi:ABC-type transporter Mla subunit MlaD